MYIKTPSEFFALVIDEPGQEFAIEPHHDLIAHKTQEWFFSRMACPLNQFAFDSRVDIRDDGRGLSYTLRYKPSGDDVAAVFTFPLPIPRFNEIMRGLYTDVMNLAHILSTSDVDEDDAGGSQTYIAFGDEDLLDGLDAMNDLDTDDRPNSNRP